MGKGSLGQQVLLKGLHLVWELTDCVPGAVWFHAHTPPTDKLLLNLAARDGVNLLCISILSLFMVGLLSFVPVPALAITLESSPQ